MSIAAYHLPNDLYSTGSDMFLHFTTGSYSYGLSFDHFKILFTAGDFFLPSKSSRVIQFRKRMADIVDTITTILLLPSLELDKKLVEGFRDQGKLMMVGKM